MKRTAFFIYGVVSYGVFFASFLYIIAFVGDFWFVPKTIDTGPESPLGTAVLINLGLMVVFGIQHTWMARPGFKSWWTKFVPEPIERSTYVLISSVLLFVFYWQWRPMPDIIWRVDSAIGYWVLMGGLFSGILLVLYSSFLIDHFDLFGLRQVFFYLRRREYEHPRFAMPLLYRMIRHPLLAGWMIAFWVTPKMTYGHLLFAVGMTVYMLIAIPFEEKDLANTLGEEYERYRARTPMLIPWRGAVPTGDAGSASA